MKTYNTVGIETDINGVDSNEELIALFTRALELCQTTKPSKASSSTQYVLSDATDCIQDAELVYPKPAPLPEVDFNEFLESIEAVCTQPSPEIEAEIDGDEEHLEKESTSHIENEDCETMEGTQMAEHIMVDDNNSLRERESREEHLNSVQNNDQEAMELEAQMTETNMEEVEQNSVHKENVSSEKPEQVAISTDQLVCSFCSKVCQNAAAIESHVRTHTKEKPYKCQHCGKDFTTTACLAAHTRNHLAKKPYKCCYCHKRFDRNSDAVEHQQEHTVGRPHKCELCDRAFKKKDVLLRHMLIHTGERSYKCDVCSKTFARKNYLDRHLQIHTAEKPLKCQYCEKTFRFKYALRKHLKDHDVLF